MRTSSMALSRFVVWMGIAAGSLAVLTAGCSSDSPSPASDAGQESGAGGSVQPDAGSRDAAGPNHDGSVADAPVVDRSVADGGADSSIKSDASDARAPEAGGGGAGGSDGGANTDASDGATVDAGPKCDVNACAACLKGTGFDNLSIALAPPCTGVTGTAHDGPAAGDPKMTLCTALSSCIVTSHCAKDDPSGEVGIISCYCGTTDYETCMFQKGTAQGVCKAPFEAAFETSEPLPMATNWNNPDYAGGYVVDRFDPLVNCMPACTNCWYDDLTVAASDAGTSDAGAGDR